MQSKILRGNRVQLISQHGTKKK